MAWLAFYVWQERQSLEELIAAEEAASQAALAELQSDGNGASTENLSEAPAEILTQDQTAAEAPDSGEAPSETIADADEVPPVIPDQENEVAGDPAAEAAAAETSEEVTVAEVAPEALPQAPSAPPLDAEAAPAVPDVADADAPPSSEAGAREVAEAAVAGDEAAPEAAEEERPAPPDLSPAALARLLAPPPDRAALARWRQFAASAPEAASGPKVALVMMALGLGVTTSQAAIETLPPQVSLAFSPYAEPLEQWIALARARGHEALLDLPMEPKDFPDRDPGHETLMSDASEAEILRRLEAILGRGSAIVGLAATPKTRLAESEPLARKILETVKARDLAYLDNGGTQPGENAFASLATRLNLAYARSDVDVDGLQASRLAIDAQLAELEQRARENGQAIGIARPFPVTLERLRPWLEGLAGRGLVLVPLTSLLATEDPAG